MPVPVVLNVVGGNILQLTMRTYAGSQLGQNVYWYQAVTGTPPAAYDAMLNAWYNLAHPFYTPVMYNGASTISATMQIFAASGEALSPLLFVPSSPHPGTAGDTPMPRQVSGLITRRVKLLKARNRGRVYIPFPCVDFATDQETPSDAYTTLLDNLRTGLMPTDAPLHVYTQDWSPGLCAPGVPKVFTDLLSTQVQQKWATQRRRGDYGTPNGIPSS